MKLTCIAIGLWAAFAAGLPAATIDVSQQTTQLLQSGDSLDFLFTANSYSQYATGMGMAASPAEILFNLISAPVGSAGQFTVAVEAPDGSAAAEFPETLLWTSGTVLSSGYDGPASVLAGSLTLSNTLSEAIFAGPEAELTLTYVGPDVTVGLPGYSLKNDLTVTLAGGPLTVGALDYGVTMTSNDAAATSEPDSAAMMVTAGVLLCAASRALTIFRKPRALRA